MTRSQLTLLGALLLGGVVLYLLVQDGSSEGPGSLTPSAHKDGLVGGPSESALDLTQPPRLEIEAPAEEQALPSRADEAPQEDPNRKFEDDIPSDWSCNYGPLPIDNYNGDDQELLRVPDSVWEEKYAGYTDGDLAAAYGRLRSEFFTNVKGAFDERRVAGLATKFPKKYKTTAVGDQKAIPFHLKKSGNIPLHTVTGYPATDGHDAYYEFIWLPPAEYPEYYLLSSEVMWLQGKAPH